MIDLKLVRENPDAVRRLIADSPEHLRALVDEAATRGRCRPWRA